jgi:hypothetical protein
VVSVSTTVSRYTRSLVTVAKLNRVPVVPVYVSAAVEKVPGLNHAREGDQKRE